MKRAGWLYLVWVICAGTFTAADAQQIVYVVRHGEKLDDSKDPPLSAAGDARAARLARMLETSGVTSIFTTQYQRTVQFAAPVARALKITPVVHPAGDTPGLLRRIWAHGADDIVLVVGHGNTVPEILKGLGVGGAVKIAETDFDDMFVLVPRAPAAPAVARLKY
jgi:broad specificity phosphatase PhoE